MSRIYLVGPRASGKTTLGKRLASIFGCPFYDTDRELQSRFGAGVSEIVAKEGWKGFRAREHSVLVRLVSETAFKSKNVVIATGGGIVLEEDNRSLLKETGVVLYLSVPPKELIARLKADPVESQRPPLSRYTLEEEVMRTVAAREPLYRQLAQITLDGSLAFDALCALATKGLAGIIN